MVKEIRIYIEGGGEGHNTKAQLRKGFKIFMADLVKIAHDREIRVYCTKYKHFSAHTIHPY